MRTDSPLLQFYYSKLPKAQGGQQTGDPDKPYSKSNPQGYVSMKNNKDWFDNHANWSSTGDAEYDAKVRQQIMTGRFGLDPKSGALIKLPQSEWTKVSEEDKRLATDKRQWTAAQKQKSWEKQVTPQIVQSTKDLITNPVMMAPGAILTGGMAAGIPAISRTAAAIAPALETSIAGVPGLTAGNLVNAGFAYHGVKNVPNVVNSWQDVINNPTWGGVGNAAAETAVTGLDMLPFSMSAAKGVPRSVIQDINQAKGLLNEPKEYLELSPLEEIEIGWGYTPPIQKDFIPTAFDKEVKKTAMDYFKLMKDPRYLQRAKAIDAEAKSAGFTSNIEDKLNKFIKWGDADQNIQVGRTQENYFPFNIKTFDAIPYTNETGQSLDALGRASLSTKGFKSWVMNGPDAIAGKNFYPDQMQVEVNLPRHVQDNIPARGTVHHELKHAWTNVLRDEPYYSSILKSSVVPQETNNFLPRQDFHYYTKPTEIDAHLMTNLRDEMVQKGTLKDHFEELTKDKLSAFIKENPDYRGVDEYFKPGKEIVWDRNKFISSFNKALPISITGVAGAAALNQKAYGGLLSRTVTCSNCGHSWKAVDGGTDPTTCHKCGGQIKMQQGGDIPKFDEGGPGPGDGKINPPIYTNDPNDPRLIAFGDTTRANQSTQLLLNAIKQYNKNPTEKNKKAYYKAQDENYAPVSGFTASSNRDDIPNSKMHKVKYIGPSSAPFTSQNAPDGNPDYYFIYPKAVQPVIYREPTLKPKPFVPATKIPMGEPSKGMQIQQRTFPKLNVPNVNMSGPYMAGYHDYNTNEGVDRGFQTAEERDAFVQTLREREGGYGHGMGNISSYYNVNKRNKKFGGDISIPALTTKMPALSLGGSIQMQPKESPLLNYYLQRTGGKRMIR